MERKCDKDCRVKLTTCTFMGKALILWNVQVKTLGVDRAYAVPWEEMMKLMIRKYYSREYMH